MERATRTQPSSSQEPMSKPPTRDMPFGWEQGDPCVVCLSRQHMEYVQRAFKLRAHYILPLDSTMGRRYNKIIVFSFHEHSRLKHEHEVWVRGQLMTNLAPDGELYFV